MRDGLKLLLSGLVGTAVGGALGFAVRPANRIAGQLDFSTVIQQGRNLRGFNSLMVDMAETSYQLMIFGAVVGAIIALLVARFVTRRRAASRTDSAEETEGLEGVPASVKAGVLLLYLWLGATLIKNLAGDSEQNSLESILLTNAILGVWFWLIYLGWDSARFTFAVLLGAIFTIGALYGDLFDGDGLTLTFRAGRYLLVFGANILLFIPASRAHFRPRRRLASISSSA